MVNKEEIGFVQTLNVYSLNSSSSISVGEKDANQLFIKELLRPKDILIPAGNPSNDLTAAAALEYIDAMTILSNRSADINIATTGGEYISLSRRRLMACSIHGLTAVQGAAKGGHVNTPKLLLDHKASFNGSTAAQNELRNASGGLSIRAVTSGGHLGVVELLLEKGSSSENPPAWSGGLTAVQVSADGGHLDAVDLLVEHGSNINQEPWLEGGHTAVQIAAERVNLDVIKFLFENDADLKAEPTPGVVCRIPAIRSRHIDAMEVLLDHRVDYTDGMFGLTPYSDGTGHNLNGRLW
ncbi:hypothetical protein Q9L58_009664 [Maublancomyces gigas]|uniref:Uncharacterized protein n=1 Tax=Discina gigas TaxID=1032678 RepID=A0ABR3G7B2_9PEZI